jgi:hypothetical protein
VVGAAVWPATFWAAKKPREQATIEVNFILEEKK